MGPGSCLDKSSRQREHPRQGGEAGRGLGSCSNPTRQENGGFRCMRSGQNLEIAKVESTEFDGEEVKDDSRFLGGQLSGAEMRTTIRDMVGRG